VKIASVHEYISTACQHEQHTSCRQSCKFCQTPCLCSCGHPPSPDSGSVVGDLVTADEIYTLMEDDPGKPLAAYQAIFALVRDRYCQREMKRLNMRIEDDHSLVLAVQEAEYAKMRVTLRSVVDQGHSIRCDVHTPGMHSPGIDPCTCHVGIAEAALKEMS